LVWREPYFADAIGSGSSQIGQSQQESGSYPCIGRRRPVASRSASGEGHERIAHACGYETEISSIRSEVPQGFLVGVLKWGQAHVDEGSRIRQAVVTAKAVDLA
jgi:hypothetical protein